MAAAKVKEVNLEQGYPTADTAVRNMIDCLGTYKRQGVRSVVLIHGYGSSGSGGKIKKAVREKLAEPSLAGMVRTTCPGEEWTNRKRAMLNICPDLAKYEYHISGNYGITVVILK